MSQYSEEDLLKILEVGKMKSQARGLSKDEKKSIAKYLAKQNQSYVDINYSNSCETNCLLAISKKDQNGLAGVLTLQIPDINQRVI